MIKPEVAVSVAFIFKLFKLQPASLINCFSEKTPVLLFAAYLPRSTPTQPTLPFIFRLKTEILNTNNNKNN